MQSLILIAPQYKMPKGILYIQNIIFHLMPEKSFLEIGISKKDMLSLTKSMLRLDFREELSRLTCPIMILCGEKDKANQKAAIRMKKIIANAELYLIEQAGHEVNMEAPEKLAKLIKKFWVSNRR